MYWLVSFLLFIIILFGYPLLIFFLSRIKSNPINKFDNYIPFISILIPCYNEEHMIERKILNTLEINYPKEKFEIIVVESGSTDKTYSKLLRFSLKGEIKVIRQSERLGKSSAINQGIKEIKNDIIVLTDSDSTIEKNAIKEIVKNFTDKKVGAVVGNLTLISSESIISKMNNLFNLYLREKLRIWESKLHSASYWSGELCSFRKSIVGMIEEDIIADDRYILLKTIEKGFRAICEKNSIVYENSPKTISNQLVQKRRTMAGTLQGMIRFKNMLFNTSYGLYGMLIMPSHLIRLILSPILLLIIEILSLIAAYLILSPVLIIYLLGFCIFLTLFNKGRKIFIILLYPIIIQLSIMLGITDYLLKKHTVLWNRINKSG